MGRRPSPFLRLAEGAVFHGLRSVTHILGALPTRWILWGADRCGDLLLLLDRRGRRVGRENLRVAFGDRLSADEQRRILRASMRHMIRGIVITLHVAPLTPERVRRWVVVPVEVEEVLREAARNATGAVVVSGHIGNWEILLGVAGLFRDLMATTFLFEPNNTPGVDRFLTWLRGSGSSTSRERKGGAVALANHVRRGGIAGLLVDRNTRRNQGGIWVPFFGLLACTTPLPAFLARRNRVPIAPMFCLPIEGGRYRIHLGPELALEVQSEDAQADLHEITRRINALFEEVIRAHPEAWNWTLKRWKSRPTADRGDYPRYSLFDGG